jgi:hypothetical protein
MKEPERPTHEPEANRPQPRGRGDTTLHPLAAKHLRWGWWSILVFLTLGIVLESFHGFKVGWYLDVGNSTRRLVWTLAHAHGTLLGLVHLAFAMTVQLCPGWDSRPRAMASRLLTFAGLLLPGGFFLGGLQIYAGDPGLGILLVPVGALCLLAAVLLTARGVGRRA